MSSTEILDDSYNMDRRIPATIYTAVPPKMVFGLNHVRVDIGDAHISVEIDGGKASGSMDDIKAGTFVTITMNGKGEVTNVLVSPQSFFGGGNRRPTN